ncbi:MAG: F0F1 ATP synthase subunit delta [Candidatus Dasytiphilus stammeri]
MKKITELKTIARPYAIAAFEFSNATNKIKKWQQMLSFSAEISRHPKITPLLSGLVSPLILNKIFITICGDNIDKEFQNFIKIMTEHNRIQLLPEVLQIFKQLHDEYQQIICIEVITTNSLNWYQLTKIKNKLQEKLLRKVKFHFTINKILIAGIIIRIGDIVIDGSLRSRLNRLSVFLQS